MSDAQRSFRQKLNGTGAHKLLALDGGGIRGVITLEVLAELERMLQGQFQRSDDFVLADYFDYVAGTSTGAIIATCISLGMRVADIKKFYKESGRIRLQPANAAMQPIFADPDQVQIQGVVVGVMRKY